jgi:hypothetical protein
MITTAQAVERVERMGDEPGELAKIVRAVNKALAMACHKSTLPAVAVNRIDCDINWGALEEAAAVLDLAEEDCALAKRERDGE